jgi:hypothetical protein
MQERRHDGTDALTPRAKLEDVARAIADARNKTVILHLPGSKIERWEHGRRRVYEVQEDGSLTPLGGDSLRAAGTDGPP